MHAYVYFYFHTNYLVNVLLISSYSFYLNELYIATVYYFFKSKLNMQCNRENISTYTLHVQLLH